MQETIQIVFKPIIQAGVVFYHETILYTDRNGVQYIASGYNKSQYGSSLELVGGVYGAPTGWDRLGAFVGQIDSIGAQALYGPYGGPRVSLLNLDWHRELVASGDDLSSQWSAIQSLFNEVDSRDLNYSPITLNSNSVATSALRAAGIDPPKYKLTSSWHWE